MIAFLQNANAGSFFSLGSLGCPNPKATHVSGSPWEVLINPAEWTVVSSDSNSTLTQLSPETAITRTVEPYGFWRMSNLADVTCNYGSGTLVLKHTYRVGEVFNHARHIAADSHVNKNGDVPSFIWYNGTTSCPTTIANASNTCRWFFFPETED